MSISFKINKVKDTGGKPTVFERLGMKSSKMCPSFLKTGHCNLGSKCSFEHQKKPTEELSEKAPKTDPLKAHSKPSKKSKKESQKEQTPTKNKEKDSSKKKLKESSKSSKKSKEEISEKAKSPIPIEKQKKKELSEKTDKKLTEVSNKNKKISKEDEAKSIKTSHKKDEKVKKRKHHSSSSRSSPSTSRIKRSKNEPKSKRSKNSSPYSSKHGYNHSPSPYKRHVSSHSRHVDDRGALKTADEYMLRKELTREKWEKRMDRREEESFKNIMSEQRWSEERYSSHKSRDREHRDERAMMEAKMSKKIHKRSEERFLKEDTYRGYRNDRLVHRGSPFNHYRFKHDKETYHSSDDSISNYGSRDRRSDGYRGSMRRSRSKSSRASRYYEKGDSMNRGRLSAGMPSHISPMQPLPPPPPSSFFYNNMSLPSKMMPLGKTAGQHGNDFWDERRLNAGLVGAMSLPQFRTPMPSYRMPLHHFPEYRMPPPLNTSFPVRPSSPVDEFKARKTPKTSSYPSKTSEEPPLALERQPMSNFKLSLYQDLSEEEEENGKGTNEEEEKDGSLSGLDNDDDLSDTNSDLPLKIPLVETSDVEWSLLSSGAVKVTDTSLPQNVPLNPLDELGLSRKLAGDELFEEMRIVNFNTSKSIVSADDNRPAIKNDVNTKILENDDGFLNDIALYHVDMRKRKKKLKDLVDMVASMDQAMFARKDLYLRRMLCQLPEEEDMVYPGLAQKADIYKTAVILFES